MLLQIPGDSTETPMVIPGKGQELDPAKFFEGKSTPQDSVLAPGDTLLHTGLADTAYVVYLDSTTRIAQFVHLRHDPPQVRLFPRRTYPLFAGANSAMLKREVVIDSTAETVLIRESHGGADVRIPVHLSLDEYVQGRRAYELRKMLAEEARKPGTLTDRNDLGELLTTFTQIQIPVPPNPIFSIFGKPEIKLNINGAVDIKAGFRSTSSDQATLSQFDQTRNEPDFSQEVQVNVNGTIGDKLNILADWNTQRTFEYENQLKINYTGYEDEIVQSVEAGNVSLQTPSSFIGSSQALFGVKARFQAGPLMLTTLASQKKGQIKEVSVSGGAQEIPFEIQAWNYSTSNYFIDTSYIPYYEPWYAQDVPTATLEQQQNQIVEAEVWIFRPITGVPDGTENSVITFIELPPRPTGGYPDSMRFTEEDPGRIERGDFIRLEPSQYDLHEYLGVLSLKTSVGEDKIVGIAFRRANGQQFGEISRDIINDSTRMILKMVKPKNLSSNGPNYRIAWNMLLKNVYSLGTRNVKEAGFTLDVFRRVDGGADINTINGVPSLRVLGLDRYDASGTFLATGDGQFDVRPLGLRLNLTRAEVIFPRLRPFAEGIDSFFVSLGQTPLGDSSEFIFKRIYTDTKTNAQQPSLQNRYVIRGKATGDVTSKYNLGFNVVEGSVQVLLNGAALTPGLDFTVDYIIGEVIIRNDRALVPGANLQIKYEQNDLFQLASKTLLGARGDLALSQKTTFGFTLMNLNQQTLSDKVRLGEEPNNNTIMGFDGATSVDLPFLTSALDGLPILQTRETSSMRFSGEAAYMIPDPNTKKSTIPSDQGAGIAYIDDFEGSRRTIPLGISYTQWSQASPPADSVSFPPGTRDSVKMYSKGKMIWFNRLPTDVPLTQVYPNKRPGSSANDQITVLDLQYSPRTRGMNNYSPNIDSTLTVQRNWAGVMKSLSIVAVNLTDENLNFIEIWMQVNRGLGDTMVVDLGSISEDAIPFASRTPGNPTFNSEDLVISRTPNGTLQEGEDVGLDMRTNEQERQYILSQYGTLAGFDVNDPSGDDYFFDNTKVRTPEEDFSRINGTENSKNSPGGLSPDTEDLNRNGDVDRANVYFQYEVPLDTNRATNPFIVGGGANEHAWYQFRVPVREFKRKIGAPLLENIEFIRVGFRNIADSIALRIADFALVGNQWQDARKGDSTFTRTGDSSFAVSVVSLEDNPEYQSPPGVIRERDKTRPDEEVLANEQSLSLVLRGLPDGESRQAVKNYTLRPLDLFNYRTMKMFVHGDLTFAGTGEDAEVFLRFGSDTLHFYEYRAPVFPGWAPEVNEIIINFADLTSIKQARDSVNVLSQPIPVPGGPPNSFYRVRGNPSLTQIRYIGVGVTNPSGRGTSLPLYGEVWANELRLTSVDDSPGWAYRFDSQLKLADLGSVAFNYSKVDPNFHTLEQRFGSRQTGINWAIATNMQLEKFFPNDWVGTSFPVSYTHTEGINRPKYLPNSDILVNEAADQTRDRLLNSGASEAEANAEASRIRRESETFRVSDTYAAPTLRIGLPSQAWYIRDTFNKLTMGFNYTTSKERNPAVESRTSWQWNARIAYAVSLPTDYYFSPFKDLFDGVWLLGEYKDMKIYFAPTNLSWSFNATRSRDVTLQRTLGSLQTINRNFVASRQLAFGWKLTEGGLLNLSGDYNLDVQSTLLKLELDERGRQRTFSEIMGDVFFSDKFINFGDDQSYRQRNQFNTRPNIPNIFNIKKYFDLTFGYGVDYAWQNSLTRGDIGKSAGWNSTINVSTNFKLKQLFDPLFEDTPGSSQQQQAPRGRGRGKVGEEEPEQTDSTQAADTTAAPRQSGLEKTLAQLKTLTKVFIKVPFLDYDNINVTFNQTNTSQNSGVVGRAGFDNFWGRIPFFQDHDPEKGPSRLYQLGLISDPSGHLTNFGPRSHFPFFGWDVEPGRRAAGGILNNVYRQSNKVSFKTNRSLWEGARLDLNWNLGWSYSRNQQIATDSVLGLPTILNTTTTGNIERSFLTFPDVLFLGVFKSSLKDVSKKYAELKSNRDTTMSDSEKLSKAFEEGFEALPFFNTLFGKYTPRVNWSLRWDGLEKLSMFAGFVSRLSLDHAYNSTYTRSFSNRPGSQGEQTDNQRVAYGFAPLIGLNFTFRDLFKGSFGANFRYNTNTSFDLAPSSRNIVETLSQEVSVTASYSRKGFEIPLFGLALNNDLDVSASYSVTANSRRTYDVARLDVNTEGEPLEGTTRTVLEPRIKYVLSLRVTASVYYRYTKITPDDSGSLIPGSTTNEAGLDIHISIQ